MGSKKSWGAAIGTALLPGIGTAIGYSAGKHQDDKAKDKKKTSGVAAASETEDEKNAREKSAGEGGTSPFDDGALGVNTKKKKINTLIGGYASGALSRSDEGSTTLG